MKLQSIERFMLGIFAVALLACGVKALGELPGPQGGGSGTILQFQTPLTTKGDLLVTNGTTINRLAVGSDTQVLTADAASTNGVKWSAASSAAAAGTLTGTTLASNVVNSSLTAFGASPSFTTPILGTPTSGTLTNCTGYTVGNVSGLGAGVGTFLATPSSANLASAVSDETGSGLLVFGTSPTLTTPAINGLATGTGVSSDATASTLASRDVSGNLLTNNLIENYRTTAMAGGTTTLVVGDAFQQFFTGNSAAQTVVLPVASTLVLGMQFQIVNAGTSGTSVVTVQSSGLNTISTMSPLSSAVFTCILTSGTGTASWNTSYGLPANSLTGSSLPAGVTGSSLTSVGTLASPTLTTPVINGTITGTGQATAATASTIAMRDASANLTSNNHIEGYTTTATAASTTTLTVTSTKNQHFTGSSTQTIVLPVSSTLGTGFQFNIVNKSTGTVTVQSSGANTILTVRTLCSAVFTCIATGGTGTNQWAYVQTLKSDGNTLTANLISTGAISDVAGITTVGTGGFPILVANQRVTARTAAHNMTAYTNISGDTTVLVTVNLNVTASTTHAFNCEIAYTDETNTARTLTVPFTLLDGTTATSIANANGAVPYVSHPLHLRCKSATTITVRTQAAGTYTSVTYNYEYFIEQILQ